ncbi:MAG: energy transducer TonB [Planctomycetaceae bacterium]|nr:energy transducer TonB [Planctomycetales bacterium]MCB9921871.1 energy transducer TonB [Planctomycetaceae bacterium]
MARPRFAGQNTSIELIVARANTTWTPEPITFDLEIVDDVRVTVEPKSVQIARKQFDDLPATETAFKGLATESLRRQHSTALDLAHTRPSNNAESIAEGRPPKTFDLPRHEPRPPDTTLAVIQTPEAVGTDRTAPSFTSSPPPTYPAVAIQNRWEGTVLLRVQISASGMVDEVEVAKSSGYPVLDGAAVNAVRRWSGSPATSNGRDVATIELLPVRFTLRD